MKTQKFILIVFFGLLHLITLSQKTVEFKVTVAGDQKTINGNILMCNSGAAVSAPYTFKFRWPMVSSLKVLGIDAVSLGDNWWEVTLGQQWQVNNINNCTNMYVSGNYDGAVTFPPYAIDNNNDTIWQTVTDPSFIPKSSNASPYEFQFSTACFVPSPNKICLGQAQLRAWRWPVDADIPTNKKGWALGMAHTNRYINNMLGGEYIDINFSTAINLIEGRYTCETASSTPKGTDDWPLNVYKDTFGNVQSMPNPGQGGCFQVKPLGWQQLVDFYPHIYGSLDYAGTIETDFIGGMWSKTLYDYSSMILMDQHDDFCHDLQSFIEQASDPYAAEEILGFLYNQGAWGFNNQIGNSILNTNRTSYLTTNNIAEAAIAEGGCGEGFYYMGQVRNYLMQLGNNMGAAGGPSLTCHDAQINWVADGNTPDPNAPDYYEYNGCYDEPMSWSDIDAYLDEAFKIFHTADLNDVKTRTKAAFDALNSGNPVNFSDLASVIDTMTMAFPALSAVAGMQGKYEAKTANCTKPAVRIESFDKICPGETAELWISMMGQPPFSYTVRAPDGGLITNSGVNITTQVIKVNQPGEYVLVDFTDASGRKPSNSCSAKRGFVENAGNASATWDKGSVDANGCASGNLNINLSGTGPWDIEYTDPNGNNLSTTINSSPHTLQNDPVETGSWVLTRMVAGGCDATLNDSIQFCSSDCTPPLLSILTPDTTVCSGDQANTRFLLTGTAPFNIYYKLNGIAASSLGINNSNWSLPILTSGTLTIDSVTDAVCKNDTLNQSLTVSIITVSSPNLGSDISVCNGPINLDAGPKTVNETYLWSTNESTQTINVNSSGNYWVRIQEGTCADTDSITINIGGSLDFSIGNDTALCSSSLPFSINGPSSFSNYSWRDNTNTEIGTGMSFSASSSGTYVLEIDDNGCIGRDTIQLTILPQPNINLGDTIAVCNGSLPYLIDATTPNASYVWQDGSTNATFQANSPGDYSVKITVNGCSDSDSVYVKVGTSLTIDLGSDIDICVGAQANFDSKFSGVGATYNWYENDGVSVGNAKTYTTAPGFTGEVKVTVSDANGCTGSDSVNVNIVNPLVIDLGNDVNICSDQTSNVDVQLIPARTGLNYNWSTGSTDSTISVLPNATTKYVLTVDSAGCSYKDSMQIVVNTIPTVTLPNDTFLCVGAGQSIPLDAGAGFAGYQWSDASTATTQNINVTAAGKYVVTVTDGNGCTNKDSITVTEQNATAFNLGNDTTICPAGTKNINVPGAVSGFTYTWHDNTNVDPFVVSNEPDGSSHQVILTVTNNFGCVSKDTVVIDVQNNLPITLGDSTICEGEDITFNSGYAGGGNFTFAWNGDATNNGNTFTVTNAAAGVQAISLAIANTVEGCSGTANVNLTVNAKPDPTLSANPICEGDSVELDPGVVGATNVEWTYGANTVTNPTLWVKVSGTYAVEVTGANGCKDTASIKLDVAPVPSPTITWLDSLCTSRIVKLYSGYTDETRYSFEWSGKPKAPLDSNYAYMDVQGNYAVKVTDKLTGCSGEVQKFLTPYRTPILDANDSMSFCENQTLELKEWRGGQPSDIVYKWENLTTNEFISTNEVITVDKAGLYRLSADNHGCTDSDTVIVTAIPVPQSGLRGDTTVCFEYLDRGMKLDAGSGDGYAYKWTPNGETDQIITITTRGTYSVTITAAGCETTDRVTVKNDCPFGVWMPSAFTPNDDGVNDTWEIKGTGIQSVEVLVFNRWGELIWKGNSIGEFWDGKYMNNLVQTDVYVYKLDYSYEDVDMILHTKTVIGRVTVLR